MVKQKWNHILDFIKHKVGLVISTVSRQVFWLQHFRLTKTKTKTKKRKVYLSRYFNY